MMNTLHTYFTAQERISVVDNVKALRAILGKDLALADFVNVRRLIAQGVGENHFKRDKYGLNPAERSLCTARLVGELIAPDRNITIATLLYNLSREGFVTEDDICSLFGDDVAKLVHGLINISHLYKKQAAVVDDNFHKLLLTFAEDIRVVIIMIVDRLALMRRINHHPDEKFVRDISSEARYLYAPLAHRLGLYTIKSELEDLSLKYLNRKVYSQIAEKLNETKVQRERYVANFIDPIRRELEKSGMKFEIKGRTKSINSIWNKMKKKDVDLNGMYDLFAIRIILDTPQEQEKKDCWIAYSIVTDIYTANVSRLKDWITIPKSNGYESLHITVYGPDDKWVEVQIRTKRMDEIAERGLAAHWQYKGIKSEGDVDKWMNNVREVLEAGSNGQMELIRDMNMNLYDKEVFVFTPKGDLFKLPQGATILDFAFHIHSKVGSKCTGAKVDGKNQKLNYKLKSGDTVEILTSATQTPRQDWLNIVVTSKARNKIKQAVNEEKMKKAEMARELLYRRFKNRKVEFDEAMLSKFVKKSGYKSIIDFFVEINQGVIDVNEVIENYITFITPAEQPVAHEAADKFVLQAKSKADDKADSDILIIGNDVKGINYKFSKCCNPIFGDKIMGFIASDGAIKIHRIDCGNVKNLMEKYPYRVIKSEWSGKLGSQFAATLKVVGQDDIGIVSNITSLINKEGDTVLRSISINSNGGLFEGHLVIGISSLDHLSNLMKKIKNLKGVKDVQRTSH
ncbi:MAG: RelA/SpoT family protein [Bacteroidales bacterium]|nr:RelA/SpoT family protein [Bacteroidales bacterium]